MNSAPHSTSSKSSSGMTVLGLHFGHDASAVVLHDGRIVSHILRERLTRVKHQLGLDMATIELALRTANVALEDIDCVAVSSTQEVELIFDKSGRLQLTYGLTDSFDRPVTVAERFSGLDHTGIAATGSTMLLDYVYDEALSQTYVGQCYALEFPEHAARTREDFEVTPWLDTFLIHDAWNAKLGLRDLETVTPEISDRLRYALHIPVTVRLDGVDIPGYAVHHHLAHAGNSYYQSGFDEAAVLTLDGYGESVGYNCGMYYLGKGEALYPLWPHNVTVGLLYETVATWVGLGAVGSSGKLMGLAPYGSPSFFDERFVGNHHDLAGRFPDVIQAWQEHCTSKAESMKYDMTGFRDARRATDQVNADVAASTQMLFDTVKMQAVRGCKKMLENAGYTVPNLCLSGGTALNCPANTSIAMTSGFSRTFVEPSCDDSGIAAGAALVVYHSILGHPLSGAAIANSHPYHGPTGDSTELEEALRAVGGYVRAERPQDPVSSAVDDLVSDRVIGWFEGRSEVGPRALGHRSILSDARSADNWGRVNKIKGREWWRPLAPAVLESAAADWFAEVPLPSPFMLFNAEVRGSLLPATTHVDRTARIQTVDESAGNFYALLREFGARTGVPVLLNTSMNGPGEPIVESPREAIALLRQTGLDVMYVNGVRITRIDGLASEPAQECPCGK
jgi:carbamoyltransferase